MRKFLVILLLTILSLLFFSTFLIYKKQNLNKEILIPKGYSVLKIGEILEKEKVIPNKYLFFVYAKLHNKTLKAGVYEFKGEYSLIEVYKKIANGEVKLKLFTIIPGDNLLDIAERLEKEKIIEKDKFLNFVFNKENVKKYGLIGSSFEGYFPPESYRIDENETVETLTEKFLDIFKKKYLPYKNTLESKDFSNFYKSKLSFYEAMIIASLIEKETFLEKEKPLIASVIFNRLKFGMKLDIDPTVIYALKLKNLYNGKLTKEDLKVDSPFNTYKYKGLPPTPICSFSLSSLQAVINPVKTSYLYYVLSKDKNGHIFSENYQEHLKNVKENLKK